MLKERRSDDLVSVCAIGFRPGAGSFYGRGRGARSQTDGYHSQQQRMMDHVALRQQHSWQKVKQSRNRPGVAQRVPGGLGSQIFMTLGT